MMINFQETCNVDHAQENKPLKSHIPDDFCWEIYVELNEDLKHFTEIEAKNHYESNGQFENRRYKNIVLPEDFDWGTYTQLNLDLHHLDKDQAKNHYIQYGYFEKRVYKQRSNLSSQIFDDVISDTQNIQMSKKFTNYQYLFHKYVLKLRNPNQEITYDIASQLQIDNKKYWAHLHCYDISQFDQFYGEYIVIIQQYFSVIVTFSQGELINISNNIIYLKVQNYGMDIGAKFIALNHIKVLNINYDYILFLHSKTNIDKRKQYYEPLIKNIPSIIQKLNSSHNIGAVTPPIIFYGDYHTIQENNPNKMHGIWHANNIIYMEDLTKYYDLNYSNAYFPEGNCYILKRSIAEKLFTDLLIYNILNITNSPDINWINIYYNIMTKDINKIYQAYQKYNYYSNNLEVSKNDIKLPDCMIEHVFERLIFLFLEQQQLDLYIAPYKSWNTKISSQVSQYINNQLKTHIFDNNPSLQLNKIFQHKTITIIACHTNTQEKIASLINNIHYFKNISDKIIIVNSIEFSNLNLEEQINIHLENIQIECIYTCNDQYLQYSKWLYASKLHLNDIFSHYHNIILADDSFVIIKELFDFYNMFDYDVQTTGLISSNQSKPHYPDFLRRYNRKGFTKIIQVYVDYIQTKQLINMNSLIEKFDTQNYLYIENEPADIHFMEPQCFNWLNYNDYPIIKLQKLNQIQYDYNDKFADFDPQYYQSLYFDLKHLTTEELNHHFKTIGIQEGRAYKQNQVIQPQKYILQLLKKVDILYQNGHYVKNILPIL